MGPGPVAACGSATTGGLEFGAVCTGVDGELAVETSGPVVTAVPCAPPVIVLELGAPIDPKMAADVGPVPVAECPVFVAVTTAAELAVVTMVALGVAAGAAAGLPVITPVVPKPAPLLPELVPCLDVVVDLG